jgi:glutamine cyclotransferase
MPRAFSWLPIAALVAVSAIVLLLNLTGTPTREPPAPVIPKPAPLRKFDIVAEYPHDPNALTQGLIYAGGFLYESTGREGQSSIRKVELKTGRVVQRRDMNNRFLGEGLTEWRGQLIQLTQRRTKPGPIRYMIENNDFLIASFGRYLDLDNGARYDFDSLEPKSRFHFVGAGWGLTHNDRELIMSDGTSMLRFLNPDTMKWQGQIGVTDNGKGIRWLNELESSTARCTPTSGSRIELQSFSRTRAKLQAGLIFRNYGTGWLRHPRTSKVLAPTERLWRTVSHMTRRKTVCL